MIEAIKTEWQKRPWWMNGLFAFCLYMTFVYEPWDILFKPFEQWEEVWLGLTITGWAAKVTEPIHWAIYAAGAYGFWKMKSWMWPWAAVYSAQVTLAMIIFNIIAGPAYGDDRGGGPIASVVIGLFLATLTYHLWRAKDRFDEASANLVSGTE
jgi:hypothetical protein